MLTLSILSEQRHRCFPLLLHSSCRQLHVANVHFIANTKLAGLYRHHMHTLHTCIMLYLSYHAMLCSADMQTVQTWKRAFKYILSCARSEMTAEQFCKRYVLVNVDGDLQSQDLRQVDDFCAQCLARMLEANITVTDLLSGTPPQELVGSAESKRPIMTLLRQGGHYDLLHA